MYFKNIFVTVGTTEFNELIELFASPTMAAILKSLKCRNLTIQIGRGSDQFDFSHPNFADIEIVIYRLKPSILEDILLADLVISHAGAGSCIEVLHNCKPLIAVVNDMLMNNHQTELAKELEKNKYIFYCTPKSLFNTLKNCDVRKLSPYEKGTCTQFVKHLDELMGF